MIGKAPVQNAKVGLTESSAPYDPGEFWVARHRELAGDIRSVGNRGKSVEENETGYVRRGEGLRNFIRRELGDVAGLSLVEFGCGIGRIGQELLPLRVSYTGVDISDVAIAEAQTRVPNGTFILADLTAFKTERRYDIVLCSSVLCHMVEEAHWLGVIGAMAHAVEPEGAIVLAEDLPADHEITYSYYTKHRTMRETQAAFAESGFVLDSTRSVPPFHIVREVFNSAP